MAHHKRGKRRSVRGFKAGRWMNKNWKNNGVNKWAKHHARVSDLRKRITGPDDEGEREKCPE